jgi:hypothetical protein
MYNIKVNKLALYQIKALLYILDRVLSNKKDVGLTGNIYGIGDVATFEKLQNEQSYLNVANHGSCFNNCDELIDVKLINYFLMSKIGQKEIIETHKSTGHSLVFRLQSKDIDIPIPQLIRTKTHSSRNRKAISQNQTIKRTHHSQPTSHRATAQSIVASGV